MTQEEKDLLLKDLCARLLYNVKGLINGWEGIIYPHDIEDLQKDLRTIKPYLRPMSSMTEEEAFQLGRLIGAASYNMLKGDNSSLEELLEYVYKNHIDYFGLIPKGLALEAPEDMYNIK